MLLVGHYDAFLYLEVVPETNGGRLPGEAVQALPERAGEVKMATSHPPRVGKTADFECNKYKAFAFDKFTYSGIKEKIGDEVAHPTIIGSDLTYLHGVSKS
jgi:hypothetical protein